MERSKIYRKNPKIVARRSGAEYILVPIRDNVADMEAVFTMNETAAFVWDQINGINNIDDIAGKLADEFDTGREDALNDVLELLENLIEHQIVSA